MNTFLLNISSPDGKLFSDQVVSIILKGVEGEFAIHPGHGESTTLALEKQYNPYMQ